MPKKKEIVDEFENVLRKKYEVALDLIDVSRDGNPVFKSRKIPKLSLVILLVWIGRFIINEHYSVSNFFGGKLVDDQYIFWFTYERDAERCRKMFNQIKSDGFPRPSSF